MIKFKEMPLAHEYCKGYGIELGAAAHNPFGLKDCINVAPKRDEQFFGESQKNMCGEIAKIDYYGDANNIPFTKILFDYIISSHVIEHVPDLIGAFHEWNRVLTKDGIIFMIFPKRNALESDIGRPLSTIKEFEEAFKNKNREPDFNEHIWVFDLYSMIDLIQYCNERHDLNWKIMAIEETDSKVGNGHTVVCKKRK